MNDHGTLLDSPVALTQYLEALFREPQQRPAREAQVEASVIVEQPLETSKPVSIVEPVETPAAPTVRVQRPAIGQPLQVLLLDVWGLRMAVPVTQLNGILKWPQRLVHTPTRDPARIGMIKHRGRGIPILDLLLLIGASEQVAARAAENEENEITGTHVLLVGEERWGFACTGTRKVVTVAPEQIQSVNLPGRPWYLGTVKDQLCALIDLVALMAEVEESTGTNPASVSLTTIKASEN
jgi:purine-binding chemotaxis protein CheW